MKVALTYFYVVTTVMTLLVILTGCWVYFSLKININAETKLKWIVILCGMVLRWSLSTHMLIRDDYGSSNAKYVINWVIEEIHFLMLL